MWDWCTDWYDGDAYTRYRHGNLTAPSSGESFVVRGGSWRGGSPASFSTFRRDHFHPDRRLGINGFRCVWELGIPIDASFP
jgi:formylglycine-generating enzyme required for sulfatase activity